MYFERPDGEKRYQFVSVKDKDTVILKGPLDNEFEAKMDVLLETYRPVLESGEFWPDDLPRKSKSTTTATVVMPYDGAETVNPDTENPERTGNRLV